MSLRKSTRRRWTEKEELLLIKLVKSHNRKTLKELSTKFGRTESSITSKLNKMRIKDKDIPFIRNYTGEQEDFINSFSNDPDGDSIKDVADFFGRTYNSVGNKLVRLRRHSNYTGYLKRRWTKREDDAIRFSRGKVTYRELGELLGRSESSVSQRARVLGITKKSVDFTKIGSEIKRLAHEGYTRSQIAEKVNIDYTAVHNYIYRNNIKCKKQKKKKSEQQKQMHREFLSHAFRRH